VRVEADGVFTGRGAGGRQGVGPRFRAPSQEVFGKSGLLAPLEIRDRPEDRDVLGIETKSIPGGFGDVGG